MSSPIARPDTGKNLAHKSVNALHRNLSRGTRIDILAERLIPYVRELAGDHRQFRCVDVGCGDLGILNRIQQALPNTHWQGLDLYDLPSSLADDPLWQCYQKFDGRSLPFPDQSLDVVLFCDMLHHANGSIPLLMQEARRVGRAVLIKDSFEYSMYSRWVLKAMDFVGNWGYGVALPDRYFTRKSFEQLCRQSGLVIRQLDIGVRLYDHLPVLKNLLRPEWHFFAVLTPQDSSSSQGE